METSTQEIAKIKALIADIQEALSQAIQAETMFVHREAIANAPRSPTMAQLRKSKKKRSKKATAKAKKKAKRRPKPGGLERSIKYDYDKAKMVGSIFVDGSREASKYAQKIHDGKGRSWNNRGVGTIAKGARADDKFIERAFKDNEQKIEQNINMAFVKAVKNYASK